MQKVGARRAPNYFSHKTIVIEITALCCPGGASTQPVDWQPPIPFTKTQDVPLPPMEVAELIAEEAKEAELAVWAACAVRAVWVVEATA